MGTNRKEKKSNEIDEPNRTNRIRKRNPNPNQTLISILTPSPTLNWIDPRKEERKIKEKKRGRGRGLPRHRTVMPPRQRVGGCSGQGRRGERAGDGAVIVSLRAVTGLRQRRRRSGRVRSMVLEGFRAPPPRPLDGGVLTRWGARTPARGSTTTPSSCLLSLWCSRLLH